MRSTWQSIISYHVSTGRCFYNWIRGRTLQCGKDSSQGLSSHRLESEKSTKGRCLDSLRWLIGEDRFLQQVCWIVIIVLKSSHLFYSTSKYYHFLNRQQSIKCLINKFGVTWLIWLDFLLLFLQGRWVFDEINYFDFMMKIFNLSFWVLNFISNS